MSKQPSPNDTDSTDAQSHNYEPLAAKIETAKDHIEALEDEFPPHYRRELEDLEDEIEVLKDWTTTADSDENVEALAGATVIVETAQARVNHLQDEFGQGAGELSGRIETLGQAIQNIKDEVDDLTLTSDVHVVYVNREFIARYEDDDVTVKRILKDADRKDPSELGLFPLDGLYGTHTEDKAFPADHDLDFDEPHRTYFETTSDGGKIA